MTPVHNQTLDGEFVLCFLLCRSWQSMLQSVAGTAPIVQQKLCCASQSTMASAPRQPFPCKGPSRPGRFCIPFTDAKPAREMHMRRNLLHGDGRKNCGWRVDLRLDSMDIIKIFPCGNYYRKSYRTLKLFIVHIKRRSYIICDIGTIFIILKSILIILVYIF